MKTKLAMLSLSGFLLIGCGEQTIDNTGKESEASSSSEVIETEKEAPKDELLVTNGPLLEVGQYSNDEDYGRIELEKITNPGDEHEIAPGVIVTFGDIKIINFENIPQKAQEKAEILYGFSGNQGYDLQFEYTVENKNDFRIDNAVVEKVILSDGEQIDRSMYADETFDLEAGSKASKQIGHVAIPSSDIESVRFYVNPYTYDSYEELESQPIEVSFE